MYLSGMTQSAIGQAFSLTQQQISLELQVIRSEWKASALRDFDAAKEQELAKLDNLEARFWEGWERSVLDREKRVKETIDKTDGSEVKRRTEKEGQAGDPRFLAGVHDCIAERCKILGVYAAAKLDVKSNAATPNYALAQQIIADPALVELAGHIADRVALFASGHGSTIDAADADAVAKS